MRMPSHLDLDMHEADHNMKAEWVWERKGQLYVMQPAMSSRILDLIPILRYNPNSRRVRVLESAANTAIPDASCARAETPML